MTGDLFAFGLMTSENAGSDTLVVPSVTLMTMLLQVRACEADGVPHTWPVVDENDAKPGLFTIENVSLLPSASVALGVNDHATPTVPVVAGVPVILGAAAEAVWVLSIENRSRASAPSGARIVRASF